MPAKKTASAPKKKATAPKKKATAPKKKEESEPPLKDDDHAIWEKPEKPDYCFLMILYEDMQDLLKQAEDNPEDEALAKLKKLYSDPKKKTTLRNRYDDLSGLEGEEREFLDLLVAHQHSWTEVSNAVFTHEHKDYLEQIPYKRVKKAIRFEIIRFYFHRLMSLPHEYGLGYSALLKAILWCNKPTPCILQYVKGKNACAGVLGVAYEKLVGNLKGLDLPDNDYVIAKEGFIFLQCHDLLRIGYVATDHVAYRDHKKKPVGKKGLQMRTFYEACVMSAILHGLCYSESSGDKFEPDKEPFELEDMKKVYQAFLIARSLDCENLVNNAIMFPDAFFSDDPHITFYDENGDEMEDEDGSPFFVSASMEGFGTAQKAHIVAHQLYQLSIVRIPYDGLECTAKQIQSVLHDKQFHETAVLPNTGKECADLYKECDPLLQEYMKTGKRDHFHNRGISKPANEFVIKLVDAMERCGTATHERPSVATTERRSTATKDDASASDDSQPPPSGDSSAASRSTSTGDEESYESTKDSDSKASSRRSTSSRPFGSEDDSKASEGQDDMDSNISSTNYPGLTTNRASSRKKKVSTEDNSGHETDIDKSDGEGDEVDDDFRGFGQSDEQLDGESEDGLDQFDTKPRSLDTASQFQKYVRDFKVIDFTDSFSRGKTDKQCIKNLKRAFLLLETANETYPEWSEKSKKTLISHVVDLLEIPSLEAIYLKPFTFKYDSNVDTAMSVIDLALKEDPRLLVLHENQLALLVIENCWGKVLEHLLRMAAKYLHGGSFLIEETGDVVDLAVQTDPTACQVLTAMYFGDPNDEEYFSHHGYSTCPPRDDDKPYNGVIVDAALYLPLSVLPLFFRAARYENYVHVAELAVKEVEKRVPHPQLTENEWQWLGKEKNIISITRLEIDSGDIAFSLAKKDQEAGMILEAYGHFRSALHTEANTEHDKAPVGGKSNRACGGRFHAAMNYMMGTCHQRSNCYDVAEVFLKEALRYDPTHIKAILELSYVAMGRVDFRRENLANCRNNISLLGEAGAGYQTYLHHAGRFPDVLEEDVDEEALEEDVLEEALEEDSDVDEEEDSDADEDKDTFVKVVSGFNDIVGIYLRMVNKYKNLKDAADGGVDGNVDSFLKIHSSVEGDDEENYDGIDGDGGSIEKMYSSIEGDDEEDDLEDQD